jgi:NADPH:quinone reductase-like Zn-dependent oxidoreductase
LYHKYCSIVQVHTVSNMTDTETKTMQSAVMHKCGDPLSEEVLSIVNVPIPEPGAGELLVKVHSASINPIDWKLIRGDVPGTSSGPTGCDVSGTVEQIGPSTITDLKVGDAIYADAIETKGAFGEYLVVKATVASKKPSNISMKPPRCPWRD